MNELLSVNEALADLSALEGLDVRIQGVLHFEFEDVALYHHPKAERKDGYDSSIWLEVGTGSLGFNTETCTRLNGKLVSVHGTLFSPDPRSVLESLLACRNAAMSGQSRIFVSVT